jgi:ferric-dicitrate binding protein FerR (iron transport regulator)
VSRPDDRELMQLYDGELSPAEEQRVAELLAYDPSSQRVLDGLELVGEAVRAWADAKAGPADGIADRIMAAVAAADAPRRLPARRRRVVAAAAGALAIAASVAVAIGLRGHDATSGRAVQASGETDSALSADIEVVDFGGQAGTIFLVQADNDAPTPVVWLEDSEADPEAEECDTETL